MKKHFYKIAAIAVITCCLLMPKDSAIAKGDDQLDIIYNRAWDFIDENELDSALHNANVLFDQATEQNNQLALSKAYYVIGYINRLEKYYDVAAIKYYKGLDILSEDIPYTYPERRMLMLQNLAVVYSMTYSYENAIKYTMEALELAENYDLQEHLAVLQYNLGTYYEHTDDFTEALKWYQLSLDNAETSRLPDLDIETHNSIGNVYNEMGDFQKAREYFLQALREAKQSTNLKNKIHIYTSNLGESAFRTGDYELAREYYSSALTLSIEQKDEEKTQVISNNLGDVYAKEGRYQQAIEYYQKAAALGEPGVIDKEYKRACKNMAATYEQLGDYKNALAWNNKFLAQVDILQSTKDKLIEQNAQYRMKEMEWMLERQQQQARLASMQMENFWFKLSISLLFIVLVYSAYKAIRYYRGIRAVKKWLAT